MIEGEAAHDRGPLLRVERDALGPVEVAADALYGAHTARALANFDLASEPVASLGALLEALLWVKKAAVRANADLGVVPRPIAEAIVRAADEVGTSGPEHFPVPIHQGGGYTSLNMNANEVLANRAAQLLGGTVGTYDLVHPNDHANRSQSTNDVIPTALGLATVVTGRACLAGVAHLENALRAKAEEVGDLVRLGRTCLQDAVPLTARDGHLAQAGALARTAGDLGRSLDELLAVPLGATAIGTGIGAPRGYRELAVRYLAEESNLDVRPARDLFDALQHLDPYVRVSSDLVRVSLVQAKLAQDLRLLSSGPVGGVGEVRLPAVQPGSSIMPGKINPVLPELVLLVSFEVRGAAAAVECASAAGELELNVWGPVISTQLLPPLRRVGEAARLFADRCIAGLTWNEERVAANLAGSLAEAVERAAREGYSSAVRKP